MDMQPTQSVDRQRPKLAVFKFASCDGCQLQLLSCEDELLEIGEAVEIVHFLEASSLIEAGPYDIALVEGSISTYGDLQRIQQIRESSKYLITIGACATAGGIQALKNWADRAEFLRAVYAQPEYIDTLSTSTPIADHVRVDFELRGCPISKYQLLEVIRSLLIGKSPQTPSHSVCLDCKRNGAVCVAVTQDVACMGPITQAGCGAICPAYQRGCYGCFGPAAQPNCQALADWYLAAGSTTHTLVPLLRNFNACAEAFQQCGDDLDPNSDPGTSL
ncbi:oxidoreductase [Planctomycetaceae bacterium SH139]